MNAVYEKEEAIARVSDILEQIQRLDDLLKMMISNRAERSSIQQYDKIKKGFIEELNSILKGFGLSVRQLPLNVYVFNEQDEALLMVAEK